MFGHQTFKRYKAYENALNLPNPAGGLGGNASSQVCPGQSPDGVAESEIT